MTSAAPAPIIGPSQVRHPWRTVERTVFQLVIGIAAATPGLVVMSGVPQAVTGVGTALAVAAVITRAMAIPAVDQALQLWAPWLAAEPSPVMPGDPPGEHTAE